MTTAAGRSGRHVALLRGINVGKAKRMAMADLRRVVSDLGYRDVRTLLNSGNVVFTAPRPVPEGHAARIEKGVARSLGVNARVIVLTAEELKVALKANPLHEVAANPSRHLVAVFDVPLHRKTLQPLSKEDWAPEALVLGTRVAYMWCPDGVLASRVWAAVGRLLGDGLTTRNWATLTKLAELASE